MTPPTNKALAVLGVVRDLGQATVNQVADEVKKRTPCGVCGGTGEGDDARFGCRACYGHGRVPFGYSDAYVALKQLMGHGLVTRRLTRNEWGDEDRPWIWSCVDVVPVDPLEAAYQAPAAEHGS